MKTLSETHPATREPVNILHLEDNPIDGEMIETMLVREGLNCTIRRVTTADAFQSGLGLAGLDLIISDFTLPSFDGLRALGLARKLRPTVPFIFFSGTIGEELAIRSLKKGATDYVLKQRPDRLVNAVHRAIEDARERRERDDSMEQLYRSEERFRAFMDNSRAVAFIKDTDGRYVYINRRMEEFLGKKADQILGKTDADLFPGDLASETGWHDARVLAIGRSVETVGTLVRADGERRDTLISRFPVPNAFGRRLLGGFGIDVTEWFRGQQRLREQAAALDKAQDAICLIDLDQRVYYWSDGARRLYGWTAAEMMGKDANGVLFHQDAGALATTLKSLMSRRAWRGEFQQATKSGAAIVVESRWTLLKDDSGRATSILVVNSDITERKRLEARLLAAQRSDTAGAGSRGIAHDLNNILVPILLGIDLLRDEVVSPSGRKILDTLETSAQRGSDVIKQHLLSLDGFSVAPGSLPPVQSGHNGRPHETASNGASSPGGLKSNGLKGHGELVLLVDDETAILEMNKATLENSGYQVLLARDGMDALNQYRQHREKVAVVVTDLSMPAMDGSALIEALRGIDPAVRTICVTGTASQEKVVGVRSAGANALLSKPYSAELLLRTVQTFVGK